MALSERGLVVGPRVPRGLASAVEGLAREILRYRPQDVYTFAAHHFEQLVELRENSRASVKTFDRASSNRKHRILFDWICRDKYDPENDSNHDRYRCSNRKRNDPTKEPTIKEMTRTPSTSKLLARRRRRRRSEEEAANRSGWSITETVKVFKKHENDTRKKKSRNTQNLEKSIEKEIRSSQHEQRSPRLSKTIARYRFLRSLSVGDVYLAKNISRCLEKNHEQLSTSSLDQCATSMLEDAKSNECDKDHAYRLKRQKSAGQIEDTSSSSRIRQECVQNAARRSHSLVNVIPKGRGSAGKEETRRDQRTGSEGSPFETLPRNRQFRREHEGKERKKSTEAASKLNFRTERVEESKDHDRVEKIDAIDGDNGTSSSSMNRKHSLDNPESVVLPSVITKQCSSRHPEDTVNQDDPNYLILPPISSDASKPVKREDNLLPLPLLSKLTETIDVNRRSVILSSERRASSFEDARHKQSELDASVLETQDLEAEDDHEQLIKVENLSDSNEPTNADESKEEASKSGEHLELEASTLKNQELKVEDGDDQLVKAESSSDSNEPANTNEDESKEEASKSEEHLERDVSTLEIQELKVEDGDDQLVKAESSSDSNEPANTNEDESKEEASKSEEHLERDVSTLEIQELKIEDGNDKSIKIQCLIDSNEPASANEDKCKEETSKSGEHLGQDTSISEIQELKVEDGDDQSVKIQCLIDSNEPVSANADECKKEASNRVIADRTNEKDAETVIQDDNANVEPDVTKCLQKPTELLDDTSVSQELGNGGKLGESYLVANELKNKLIEIEMVEKNIANTLMSSETVLTSDNDHELVASPLIEFASNSESGKSSVASGNNVIIIDDDLLENVEKDSLDSPIDNQKQFDNGVREDDNKDTGRNSTDTSDRPKTRQLSNDHDLSCYVLTEGSPCEIPESVTTVIIPDKESENDDEILKFEPETDSFGEYVVYPTEPLQYSTNAGMEFLRGIEDAVDRAISRKDLGNIKEEEETEKDVSDSGKKACTYSIGVESKSLEPDEDATTETTDHTSNQEQREAASNGCERTLPSDATEPCVPELNLSSFWDTTMSSADDRSDSMNSENQSKKDGKQDSEKNAVHETEITLSSPDSLSQKENSSMVDEDSPSKRKTSENEGDLSDHRDHTVENNIEKSVQTIVYDQTGRDSPRVEEEIARELIGNLTDEMLKETQGTTETSVTFDADESSNFCSTGQLNATMSDKHEMTTTVAIEPSGISMVSATNGVNCQQENVDGSTGRDEEEETKSEEIASTNRDSMDKTTDDVISRSGSSSNDTLEKPVFECVDSSENLDQLEKSKGLYIDNPDQSENSKELLTENFEQSEKSKELFTENLDQSENSKDSSAPTITLDTAARVIQFWVRKFLSRHRLSKKSDKERKYRPTTPNTATVASEASQLSQEDIEPEKGEGVVISNDEFSDAQKSEESQASEVFGSGKNEKWPSMVARENMADEQTQGNKSSYSSRHTGEFHDSLPLPVLELPKDRMLKCMQEAVKPVHMPFFNPESPQTCVLLAFGFPSSLQLVEDGSNWSKGYVGFPPSVVHTDEPDFKREANPTNDTRVSNPAEEHSNSDVDSIREPLALDGTSKSILIEEITTADEEEEQYSASQDNVLQECASSTVDLADSDNEKSIEKKESARESLDESKST